jgi:predicted deacylase
MRTSVSHWDLPVGLRADGQPWRLRFLRLKGAGNGPATAFVAGVFGDKPLGTMTLWRLVETLAGLDTLKGDVLLCPAANPFALEAGTRISPDHLYLNRVFPGSPVGALTQQFADVLLRQLLTASDCIVDLHSGTPDMALWYSYDYGDEELSAAFGYTPIVTGMAQPGQLSTAVTAAGARSVLVEFGGGELGDTSVGVAGCLNILRYRGQLPGKATGPGSVPVIEGDVALYMPSKTGVLTTHYPTGHVGKGIKPGVVATLTCATTGERLDEFVTARDGGLLMLARSSPTMIKPGEFGCGVGYPTRYVDVPNTS